MQAVIDGSRARSVARASKGVPKPEKEVVVYDRMRENLRRYKSMPLRELIDLSINQTLARSLYTSVTAFLALLPQELGPHKIGVDSVAPGAIRTPINTEAWQTETARAELLKLIPYGRIGEQEDIARAVMWLASDASDYITGASLVVDGGMALYPAFRGQG